MGGVLVIIAHCENLFSRLNSHSAANKQEKNETCKGTTTCRGKKVNNESVKGQMRKREKKVLKLGVS